jgi:hypothetical protein
MCSFPVLNYNHKYSLLRSGCPNKSPNMWVVMRLFSTNPKQDWWRIIFTGTMRLLSTRSLVLYRWSRPAFSWEGSKAEWRLQGLLCLIPKTGIPSIPVHPVGQSKLQDKSIFKGWENRLYFWGISKTLTAMGMSIVRLLLGTMNAINAVKLLDTIQ